jgi:dTDP-4-dehydrorhamnose 3,5-epimerase-like enzyme
MRIESTSIPMCFFLSNLREVILDVRQLSLFQEIQEVEVGEERVVIWVWRVWFNGFVELLETIIIERG